MNRSAARQPPGTALSVSGVMLRPRVVGAAPHRCGLEQRSRWVEQVMDQDAAPLVEALADYHRLGRYGFTPPGHRQGRGVDAARRR